MTKILIAGLATIVIAGTALVGTGIYAANTSSSGLGIQGKFSSHMGQGYPEFLIETFSGKVSTEALTALQSLMTKHKTQIDAARSNTGTTFDKTAMDTQRKVFKTEMDALIVKYPELKAAMPQIGRKMDRGNGKFEATIATLPAAIQTEIKTIRDEYRTKQIALKTEKKAKIDIILAKYPEIKTKLDALEVSRHQGMEGKRQHGGKNGGQRGIKNNSSTTTNTNN